MKLFWPTLVVASVVISTAPTLAFPQSTLPQLPKLITEDSNGVNMADGDMELLPTMAIGSQDSGISLMTFGFATNFSGSLDMRLHPMGDGSGGPMVAMVNFGSGNYEFVIGGGSNVYGSIISMTTGPFSDQSGQGASFNCTGAPGNFYSGGTCTLVLEDGTKVNFYPLATHTGSVGPNDGQTSHPTDLLKPDGETIALTYYNPATGYPLAAVNSSLGWMIKNENSAVTGNSSQTLLNSSIFYCSPTANSCSSPSEFPYRTYSVSGTTGTVYLNGTTLYSFNRPATGPATYSRPSGASKSIWLVGTNGSVSSVTIGSSTWSYNWSATYAYGNYGNRPWTGDTVTRTNPDASVASYVFGDGLFNSQTDELSHTTKYTYNGSNQFGGQPPIYQIINPGATYSGTTLTGGYTQYDHTHGALTKVSVYPKGGGTPLVTTLTVPASCTPSNYVVCNKPTAVVDPRGNETDFTYDPVHGGVLSETDPPDSNGVRPQKRYTYSLLYPKVLNASGVLVNSTPVYRLTGISECMTATTTNPASCVHSAAERVTTYAYNSNNLLRTSATVAAGDGSESATTNYTYDDLGDVVAVDGPRTDVDDTSYTTYDLLRRPVYEIGVDPDGTGSLKRTITKHNYDVDGREYLTQVGYGSTITFVGSIPIDVTDFTPTAFTRNTYDATTGLLIKTEAGQP